MSEVNTRADSCHWYHTGASSDGNAQADADLCLGNFRASNGIVFFTAAVSSPIANIDVDFVAGRNGTGDGTLTASGDDDLHWTPPGGSQGATVTILNGETKILEGGGGEPGKYIQVTRTSASVLTGTATVTLTDSMNNAVGFDDVSSAEASAGDTEYRCIAIKNDSSASVTDLKIKVGTLGTQQTSDGGQLGASGAGTIVTTGSFATFPDTGFVVIKTGGGTEREIVYYESRTATVLTVAASGRELLGSSAAAGAASDTIDAIPGIAISLDAPTSQPAGSFIDNTGADEDTAPGALVFTTPITDADALSIGTLAAGEIYGVWIKRETPAGAKSQPGALHKLVPLFDSA